jgi:hypothetical protein
MATSCPAKKLAGGRFLFWVKPMTIQPGFPIPDAPDAPAPKIGKGD